MNNGSTLWWSYDPEKRSFGSIPAGPMLLPALGILAVVAIFRALRHQGDTPEAILGRDVVNSVEYKKKKARHDYLVQKKINAAMERGPEFTLADHTELVDLQYSGINGSYCPF